MYLQECFSSNICFYIINKQITKNTKKINNCSFNLNAGFKVKLNFPIKIKHKKCVREIRTINFRLKSNEMI